jgi:hypothetical protein
MVVMQPQSRLKESGERVIFGLVKLKCVIFKTIQALQFMKFRESGDQDNDHEGKCEEVVIKIMITMEIPRKW